MWALTAVVVTLVVLSWLEADPSLIGVSAAVLAATALAWFAADVADVVAATGWSSRNSASREGPTLDGRLAILRRTVESAAEPPRQGETARPAAIELQAVLRRATEHRLGGHLDDAELPEDLARYLSAEPAPHIQPTQLDRLLTRIEDL